jgi:hypothetical protein
MIDPEETLAAMPARTMTPGFQKLIAACAISGVVAAFSALGVAIGSLEAAISASHHSTAATNASTSAAHAAARAASSTAAITSDIRELLLNGKTASAIDAKKSAHELKLLIAQQKFDHRQTEQGTKTLANVEAEVEANIDATVKASVESVASRVEQRLGVGPK